MITVKSYRIWCDTDNSRTYLETSNIRNTSPTDLIFESYTFLLTAQTFEECNCTSRAILEERLCSKGNDFAAMLAEHAQPCELLQIDWQSEHVTLYTSERAGELLAAGANIACDNCDERCTNCFCCSDCECCDNCEFCLDCVSCDNCVDCTFCGNCESCVYCAHCDSCKKCAVRCTQCRYCHDCWDCYDCDECHGCGECEACTECRECKRCSGCSECEQCDDCCNCEQCRECTYCSDCTRCIDCNRSTYRYLKGNR